MDSYVSFTRKLDVFLRRFYLNKAFKGLLMLLSLLFVLLIIFSVSEYFSFFSVPIRTVLFWFFLTVASVGFLFLCLYPFLQAMGLVRRMSYKQTARYLASRYPELDDRLYNIIDLQAIKDNKDDLQIPISLLEAAISQVSSRFATYRFEKSIRLKSNRKYLYILLLIVSLIAVSWFVNPRLLSSSKRIVHYKQYFEPEFPFKMSVVNPHLHVAYEEDFVLKIRVEGEFLPSEVFLVFDGQTLFCSRTSLDEFEYVFTRVQRDVTFQIGAGRYMSEDYCLKVDYKPLLSGMKVVLHYPFHTGLKTEVIDNTLDLDVPQGTLIDWELLFEHARFLDVNVFEIGGSSSDFVFSEVLNVDTVDRPVFYFSKQAMSSFAYTLCPSPFSFSARTDTLRFSVNVIPDAYPRIEVRQLVDTTDINLRFFSGRLTDDYGFSALYFRLYCVNPITDDSWSKVDTLFVDKKSIASDFTYYLDLRDLSLNPGDDVSYSFEVRDNDVLNGYKAAYSETFNYRKMSEEEIRNSINETSVSIDWKLSLSLQSMKDYEEDVHFILEDLLSKTSLTWQDRKNLELLIERRQEIYREYESMKEELRVKEQLQSEIFSSNPKLDAKKKELQELFDKLFDESAMAKLEELQRLMEENKPKDEIVDALESLKQEGDFLTEDLERNLELYRKLELEDRLQTALEDARRLQEKSAEIENDMSDLKRTEFDENKGRLDSMLLDLKKRRENLEKKLKDISQMNSSLEEPTSFKVPDSLLNRISEKMEETSSDIHECDASSAKQNQQQTTGMLQDLAENIENQMNQIEQESMAEDAAFIRLLLKSVVRVSFAQENLMDELSRIRVNDPYYAEIIRKQSSLVSEIGFVIDSVRAISKRQPQVALTTDKEVKNLLVYTNETMSQLLRMNDVHYQRYRMSNRSAMTAQQYTMTSLNNLALLLSESLDNIQQQLQMKGNSSGNQKGMPQMSSSGQGKEGNMKMPMPSMNPGDEGRPSQSLQQMQEDLNRQLEALKNMLKEYAKQTTSGTDAKKSVQGKTGSQTGTDVSEEKISESFARAAAKQEMIRRMLQQKMQESGVLDPQSASKLNRVLGDMERTERDLVNRILNNQLMARQKNIETRLLEAENAELKREKDEGRESKEGRQFDPFVSDSLNSWFEKERGIDVIRESVPTLQPYYQKKVQDYFFRKD